MAGETDLRYLILVVKAGVLCMLDELVSISVISLFSFSGRILISGTELLLGFVYFLSLSGQFPFQISVILRSSSFSFWSCLIQIVFLFSD